MRGLTLLVVTTLAGALLAAGCNSGGGPAGAKKPGEPSARSPGSFLEYHDVRDLVITYRGDEAKVLALVRENVTPEIWEKEIGIEIAMQDGYLAVTAPRAVQKAIHGYLDGVREEEGLNEPAAVKRPDYNPVQEQEDQERLHPVQPPPDE
ncbi:MAG: hypothetical protein HYY93_15255 [Planctomycetes bacterium]|nr:hypothetical protein [Planctomycetota bacterium]